VPGNDGFHHPTDRKQVAHGKRIRIAQAVGVNALKRIAADPI